MYVCIFGLGRIGLPITLVCADSGYKVVGIDISKKLINNLKDGKTVFYEFGLENLLKKHLNKNFIPKHQDEGVISDLMRATYIILAVGTGFAKYPDKPNLAKLFSIIDQLIESDIREKTIILRVTLPIGTSDEIKNIIENKTDLKEGVDFWFSFVPERIMEGKAILEERSLPKIVGTYTDKGFEKVRLFFEKIGGDIIRVSNPRTAEFIKLIDNSWRNTRFAFANELSFLAEKNNIDVMEAIKSANRGYKRNEIPIPGPVSGYCLGKDPYLLELSFEKVVQQRGFNSLWYYGRKANDWHFQKIVDEVKGTTVLVAGLSFKENIDDFRYSHGLEIVRNLLKKECKVLVYDPFLDNNIYTKLPIELTEKVIVFHDFEKALKEDFETIIITTKHDIFQKESIRKIIKELSSSVKIIDLWHLFTK